MHIAFPQLENLVALLSDLGLSAPHAHLSGSSKSDTLAVLSTVMLVAPGGRFDSLDNGMLLFLPPFYFQDAATSPKTLHTD